MNRALPPANLLRSAGAPHPAAKPDSNRLVHPTRLSVPQIWLYGLVEHPPSVAENGPGRKSQLFPTLNFYFVNQPTRNITSTPVTTPRMSNAAAKR